MKIIILQGSPNINGSTNLLVNSFIEGAKSSNHDIKRIDINKLNINPCIGCISCGYEGPCIYKDDNELIKEEILTSDLLVFASPLYYYGFTSQLKKVIDRFCSYNSSLHSKHLKSILITPAWNSDDWTFDAILSHYNTLVKYCNFDNIGTILGYGCGTTNMTNNSKYIKEAYELGKNL